MVSLQDLFYLWCLVEGTCCNLGYCFASYFEKMASQKKGTLYRGAYITRLAKNLEVFRGTIPLGSLIVKPKMVALEHGYDEKDGPN